ncbi:hypothetical protein I79_009000 [Cricetulus griseus]|uniref:Uncharacterized protein n=1 Tax=Cricetulus griseus TaxID=10029 RepID=G3HEL3_CRIGR|nr:hypothetical protein I79_009000 [Cricetulus griseus]
MCSQGWGQNHGGSFLLQQRKQHTAEIKTKTALANRRQGSKGESGEQNVAETALSLLSRRAEGGALNQNHSSPQLALN